MLHCSNCGNDLRPQAKFCGFCGGKSVGVAANQATNAFASPAVAQWFNPVHQPEPTQAPSTFKDVIDHIKACDAEKAANATYDWWMSINWGIRLAAVGGTLGLITFLLIYAISDSLTPQASFLIGLIGLPLWLGFLITIARPEPFVGKMFQFIRWSGAKRDRARVKGTFVAKWFFRPLYGSFCLTASATESVTDPYLRVGLMLGLQLVTVYLALFVAYAAIMIVLVFACLIISLWLIGWILSQSSGSSSSSSSSSSGISTGWFPSGGRSENRTDFLGDQYVQHTDDQGRKIGYSEQKTGFFGDAYTQHYARDGTKIGTTENREGFFGGAYEQNYDQQGHKAGYSENRETFFGNEYQQHCDQEGHKTGRSEEREGFFGDKYIKHEGE